MNAIGEYRRVIEDTLNRAFSTQDEALRKGADMLCEASMNDRNIFAFGCSHAMLPMFELYYRTGGMATINPVRAPGLFLDIDPATMTSKMERMNDYGRIIVESLPIGEGDVMILHSVSGRNNVTIDVSLCAKERGAKIIVLTNMEMTKGVVSRHPSGRKLYETADLVIDNCGCFGDSSIDIDGVSEKVAPTSTVIAASLLNAMMAQAVADIVEKGGIPPVFVSANTEGGDEHNRKMLEKYRNHIFYM